eukprot:7263544-Karenia_brevis.AAC.1
MALAWCRTCQAHEKIHKEVVTQHDTTLTNSMTSRFVHRSVFTPGRAEEAEVCLPAAVVAQERKWKR